MKERVVPMERGAWEREAAAFADHNYRQGWAFGLAAASHVGAASEHVGVMARSHAGDERVIALADVRVKSLPVVGGGVAYINGGPLVRRAGDSAAAHRENLRHAIDAIHAEYVKRRGMVLRVVGTIGEPEWNAAQDETWRAAGFAPTTMAAKYRTMMVPLREAGEAKTVAAIRTGLAQKWRNCLNKAERQGVTVSVHRDVDAMRRFASLYDEFVVRKGIHANHDAAFFVKVQEAASGDERLTIRLAERNGELLAGHVSSVLGDTCVYLLGATSPAGLPCNAAYLLQWDTIRASCEAGLTWYDLGGIDPDANPGVYHFKEGMRGVDVTAPGPFEAASKGVRGMMSASSEKLYRSWRERKKARSAADQATGPTQNVPQ